MSIMGVNPIVQLSPQRVMQSIKRWYPIPITLAVIGALLGALGGTSIRPTAEALVSVVARNQDPTAMARVMETTVQQVRAPAVFERAAMSLGEDIDPDDLRDRTRISAVSTSQILAVYVVAATVDEATRQADAVVDAAIRHEQAGRTVALKRVTESVRSLMEAATSKVKDAGTEQARLIRLGAALADSQSTVALGEVSLEPLQSARPARLSASATSVALFCGLGGGLLGLAVALLLGVTRGPVANLQEMGRLYPHLPVIDRRDLDDVLALEANTIATILIAGVSSDRERLGALREQLASSRPANELTLLVSGLNDTVVRRVNSDASTLVLVAVDTTTLQLKSLGRRLDQLTTRAYLMELPPCPT